MTMPEERTRAVLQTREFLIELKNDKQFSEEIRDEARRLLRHYPTLADIRMAGTLEEQNAGTSLLAPVFTSDVDNFYYGNHLIRERSDFEIR